MIEEIFVSLYLKIGNDKDQLKPLDCQQLLDKIIDNCSMNKRFALIGKAGAGKSTLLAKIAYDWATGKCLQIIDLLFLLPLGRVNELWHIGDIATHIIPQETEDQFVIDDFMKDSLYVYIDQNPRKVLIFMDGLDEHNRSIVQSGDKKPPNKREDITGGPPNEAISKKGVDILGGVLRGSILPSTPVIVTTQPWRAIEITGVDEIMQQYTCIQVEGFRKDDVKTYVRKFFQDDEESLGSLLHLMRVSRDIIDIMAPYPIFCCMLCDIWKDKYSREKIEQASCLTLAQLFRYMLEYLKEQYVSKIATSGDSESKNYHGKICEDMFVQIGKKALDGLWNQQTTFGEQDFKSCGEMKNIALKVGVLSLEENLLPLGERGKKGVLQRKYVSFPHRMFQDYLGGVFLATLYETDHSEFLRLVKTRLLTDIHKFAHLILFTASQTCETGRVILKWICKPGKNLSFAIDVAFECQHKDSISPAISSLREVTELELDTRLYLVSAHNWSAFKFVLAICGNQTVNNALLIILTNLTYFIPIIFHGILRFMKILYFDAVEFSERCSEEVISVF